MYEDHDTWPLKCPECGEEFTEKIGRLKENVTRAAVLREPGLTAGVGAAVG